MGRKLRWGVILVCGLVACTQPGDRFGDTAAEPTASGPSSPAVTPTSVDSKGLIVFDSDMDGHKMQIHTMRPDGTGIRLIKTRLHDQAQPAWSPDGGAIAFSGVEKKGGMGDIYLMEADGFPLRQVTDTPSENELSVSWSPDSERLVFDVGLFRSRLTPKNTDLWVMDIRGENRTQLTSNEVIDTSGSWSPDKERILFGSDMGEGHDADLWVIDPNGVGLQQLTDSVLHETVPEWSPDGKQIAFTRGVTEYSHIFVCDADGTNPIQLTRGKVKDVLPTWSPDGTRIAFARYVKGNTDIWVMNADGSDQERITTNPGLDTNPDWGP